MEKFKRFFKKLFLGTNVQTKKLRPAIKNQCHNVKRVWNNENYDDFGIERILRLFLVMAQFLFPSLYIRDISGRFGFMARKITVETQVIIKLFLPLIFLISGLANKKIVFILTIYLLSETLVYLGGLIFLSDVYASPISKKRSLLSLIMNYLEISFDFAVIYYYLNSTILGFFKVIVVPKVDILYFSFVTSATVGYGDILVNNRIGKIVVILQILISFIFVVLVFNFFSINSSEVSYFNKKKGGNKK